MGAAPALVAVLALLAMQRAAAANALVSSCGAQSALSITNSSPECATAILNAANNCPASCRRIKSAIVASSSPTLCQNAATKLPAFKTATRSQYIKASADEGGT